MSVPERIVKQFKGKVPQYLVDLFKWKARHTEERRKKHAAQLAKIEREKREALERRNALRRPPRNVRIVGRFIEWDPPTTVHERAPNYYIVSEQGHNGEWFVHGTHIRHLHNQKRYRCLLNPGIAAKVESDYGDGGLGVHFYSPTVYPPTEAKPNPIKPADCKPEPTREARVLASLQSYKGPYTFARKVPILSDLRRHSGVSDLSRKERNRFWKLHCELYRGGK